MSYGKYKPIRFVLQISLVNHCSAEVNSYELVPFRNGGGTCLVCVILVYSRINFWYFALLPSSPSWSALVDRLASYATAMTSGSCIL